MTINVHLETDDIKAALKAYVEGLGFFTEQNPYITMTVDKGDVRESETWNAVICGCTKKS